MANRTKITLCVCLIVVVLAVVGIFFIRKKEQKLPSADKTSVTAEEMLKLGDRGDNVRLLQQFLNARLICRMIYDKPTPTYNDKELLSLDVDGIFGPRTEAACIWWFGRSTVKLSELE